MGERENAFRCRRSAFWLCLQIIKKISRNFLFCVDFMVLQMEKSFGGKKKIVNFQNFQLKLIYLILKIVDFSLTSFFLLKIQLINFKPQKIPFFLCICRWHHDFYMYSYIKSHNPQPKLKIIQSFIENFSKFVENCWRKFCNFYFLSSFLIFSWIFSSFLLLTNKSNWLCGAHTTLRRSSNKCSLFLSLFLVVS